MNAPTKLEYPLAVSRPSPNQPLRQVRTRRAYFDCRYGQLHVRTAFPETGGFDEYTTLFCAHPQASSSRIFSALLSHLAKSRSAYAPDAPGSGESDPPGPEEPGNAQHGAAVMAMAMADLARDLRLNQIDALGLGEGAAAVTQLALDRPDILRRLVLIGPRCTGMNLPPVPTLLVDIAGEPAGADAVNGAQWQRVDCRSLGTDPVRTAADALAKVVTRFLDAG
jgi:pimeloyl-ACP methyl ester carboxylesterase